METGEEKAPWEQFTPSDVKSESQEKAPWEQFDPSAEKKKDIQQPLNTTGSPAFPSSSASESEAPSILSRDAQEEWRKKQLMPAHTTPAQQPIAPSTEKPKQTTFWSELGRQLYSEPDPNNPTIAQKFWKPLAEADWMKPIMESKLVKEAIQPIGEGINKGLEQLGSGIKEANTAKEGETWDEKQKRIIHGNLGAITGIGTTLFNMIPVAMEFNTVANTLKSSTNEDLKKVVDAPFTVAHTLAKAVGYNPEEGSSPDMLLGILDLATLAGAGMATEKLGEKAENKIASFDQLKTQAQKVANKTATPEEEKEVTETLKAIDKVSLNDIVKAGTKSTSPVDKAIVNKLAQNIESPEPKTPEQAHEMLYDYIAKGEKSPEQLQQELDQHLKAGTISEADYNEGKTALASYANGWKLIKDRGFTEDKNKAVLKDAFEVDKSNQLIEAIKSDADYSKNPIKVADLKSAEETQRVAQEKLGETMAEPKSDIQKKLDALKEEEQKFEDNSNELEPINKKEVEVKEQKVEKTETAKDAREGFYTEDEIEKHERSVQEKIDDYQDRVEAEVGSFNKMNDELNLSAESNKKLNLPYNDKHKVYWDLINERDRLAHHNEKVLYKLIDDVLTNNENIDNNLKNSLIEHYFKISTNDNGAVIFNASARKGINALSKKISNEALPKLAEEIARYRASEMGLDFDGLFSNISGWSNERQQNFLKENAKIAKDIQSKLVDAISKGYSKEIRNERLNTETAKSVKSGNETTLDELVKKHEELTKAKENAIQKQSASGVLQHPQEGAGETRSERERVESSKQGTKTPEESNKVIEKKGVRFENEGKVSKLEPKSDDNGNLKGKEEGGTDKNSESVTEPKAKTVRAGNRTPKAKRPVTGRAKEALNIEPKSPYEAAMQYFIGRGQLHPSGIEKMFGGGKKNFLKERQKRIGYTHGEGKTIDGIAHHLWETQEQAGQYDTSKFRDAVEQVILNHNSSKTMVDELLESNRKHIEEDYYYTDLPDDIHHDSISEAHDYWDQLTPAEQSHLANDAEANIPTFIEENPYKSAGEIKATKEYDEHLTDLDDQIDAAKKSKQNKLNKLNKGADLFGAEAKTDELFGTEQDLSKENIDAQMKPYNDVIDNLEKEKQDFVKGKDKFIKKYEGQTEIPVEKAEDPIEKLRRELLSGIHKAAFDDGILMGSIPFAKEVWNGAIEVVAKAVDKGIDVAIAVRDAIEHIKSTDWYKGLSSENQKRAEKHFEDKIKTVFEETKPVEEEPKRFKITHDAIDKHREELGLDPIEKGESDIKKDFTEAVQEYPFTHKDLAAKLVDEGRPATRKEVYTLGLGAMELKNRATEIRKAILEAQEKVDVQAIHDLKADLAITESNMDTNHEALKKVSSEAGKALQAMQVAIAEDTSLEGTLLTARSYAKDGKLTEKQTKELTDVSKRLEEAEKKLKDYQEKTEKEKAQKVIDELSVEEKIRQGVQEEISKRYNKLPQERKVKIDKAISFLDDLESKIKNNTYGSLVPPPVLIAAIKVVKGAIKTGAHVADAIQAGIDYIKEKHKDWSSEDEEKFTSTLRKGFKEKGFSDEARETKLKVNKEGKIKGLNGLLKELISKGFKDVESIVKEIQKDYPDLSAKKIRDEISGYGKTSKLSTDPIDINLREVKRISGLISALEEIQTTGEPPKKTGREYDERTIRERELRKEIEQALRETQSFKDEALAKELAKNDPEQRWKTLLERYKRRLTNQKEELQAKREAGDFEIKKREELKLDSEALGLQRAVNKEKALRKKELEKIRLENRTPSEKLADGIIKFMKFGILAGLQKPILKLGIAGAAKGYLINPINTVVAGIYSHTPGIRNIFQQSPQYRSKGATKALIHGIAEAWSKKTGKDILNQAATGINAIVRAATLGKVKEAIKGVSEKRTDELAYGSDKGHLPPSIGELWNIEHKILKTPLMNAAFRTSFEKNLQFLHDKGHNITDPVVIQTAADAATAEANRQVYLNKNKLTSAYQAGLRILAAKAKDGSTSGKMIAKLLEGENLIVSVTTNFALEQLESTPLGFIQAARTEGFIKNLKKGINSLPPDVANKIARQMTNATSGTLALAIGYALYQNHFGGNVYIPKPKSKDNNDKMKDEEAIIFGQDIPSWGQHWSLMQMMQLGAGTARMENEYNAVDENSANLLKGFSRAALSTAGKIPMVKSAGEMYNATQSDRAKDKLINGYIDRLMIMPGSIAKHYDTDKQDEPIKRDPKTIGEQFKSNIPGLRQEVPTKEERKIQDEIDKNQKERSKTSEEKHEKKSERKEKSKERKAFINKVKDYAEEHNLDYKKKNK